MGNNDRLEFEAKFAAAWNDAAGRPGNNVIDIMAAIDTAFAAAPEILEAKWYDRPGVIDKAFAAFKQAAAGK